MTINKLIDIHTHLVPSVDDGSQTLSESISIIKKMIEDGITDIVCTPHFQSVVTKASYEEQVNKFNELKEVVKKEELAVSLYLGFEVRYREFLSPSYENLTINNTKYILLEFDFYNYMDIEEISTNFISQGYKVIIAHVERYTYLKYEDYVQLKSMGVLLQVNAKPIVYPKTKQLKKTISKMLKDKLVDFIASDVHNLDTRRNHLKEAYEYLKGKIDKKYLDEIFYYNAKEILEGS